jgi:hypothetical protein
MLVALTKGLCEKPLLNTDELLIVADAYSYWDFIDLAAHIRVFEKMK